MKTVALLGMVLIASLSHRGLAQDQSTTQTDTLRVIQFLDGDQAEPLWMVEGGRRTGIIEGEIFNTVRASDHGRSTGQVWVGTGQLKVLEVHDSFTIAKLTADTTNLSRTLFPQFPGVMAGDLAVRHKVKLQRRQTLLPATTITYRDLFQDPGSAPSTFELHSDGGSHLSAQAAAFATAKLSLLVVEGHTDWVGSSSDNQIESYQRALTIRQYLIDDLGFDEERVIAIGYGEAELLDPSGAPGAAAANRRIVLKAVPLPGS